jgi:hypothetical protein
MNVLVASFAAALLSGSPPSPCGWQDQTGAHLPGTNNPLITSVSTKAPNDVWAVGHEQSPSGPPFPASFYEHFDGTSWAQGLVVNPPSEPVTLTGVSEDTPSDVWAVGNLGAATAPKPLAERWNGSAWSIIPTANLGSGALSAVHAFAPNDAWAVGYRVKGKTTIPIAEHWDGALWSLTATQSWRDSSAFASVSGTRSGDVWAVGTAMDLSRPGHPTTVGLAEHWNGKSWQRFLVPVPISGGQVTLYGVTAIAANDAWAVGSVGRYPLAEHWNGGRWVVVPTPGGSETLLAVSNAGSKSVWAAGYLPNSSPPSLPTVLGWDGMKWSISYAAPTGALLTIAAVDAADVFAAGGGYGNPPNAVVLAYCR